eukprot:Rhum_TRINITY_DN21408_c0_g1::Rhum_TRINITY_DN21408_c0_g1_i1::g.174003::m.174003
MARPHAPADAQWQTAGAHFNGTKVRHLAAHPVWNIAAVMLKHDPTHLYLFDLATSAVLRKITHGTGDAAAGSGEQSKWGDVRKLDFYDRDTEHALATPLHSVSFRECSALKLSAAKKAAKGHAADMSTGDGVKYIAITYEQRVALMPTNVVKPSLKSLARGKEQLFFNTLTTEEIQKLLITCSTPLASGCGVVVGTSTGKLAVWDVRTGDVHTHTKGPKNAVTAARSYVRTRDDIVNVSCALVVGAEDGTVTCYCVSMAPRDAAGFRQLFTVRADSSPVMGFCLHRKRMALFATTPAHIVHLHASTGDEVGKAKLSKKLGTPLGTAVLVKGRVHETFLVPYQYNKVVQVVCGPEGSTAYEEVLDLKSKKGSDVHVYSCVAAGDVLENGILVAHNQGLRRVAPATAENEKGVATVYDKDGAPSRKATLANGNVVTTYSLVEVSDAGVPTWGVDKKIELPQKANGLYSGRWLGCASATKVVFYDWDTLAPVATPGGVGSLPPPDAMRWGKEHCAMLFSSEAFVYRAAEGKLSHQCTLHWDNMALFWMYGGTVLFVDTLDELIAVFPYDGGYDYEIVAALDVTMLYHTLWAAGEGSIAVDGPPPSMCHTRPAGRIMSMEHGPDNSILVGTRTGKKNLQATPSLKWRLLALHGHVAEARSWATEGQADADEIETFLSRRSL